LNQIQETETVIADIWISLWVVLAHILVNNFGFRGFSVGVTKLDRCTSEKFQPLLHFAHRAVIKRL